MQCFLGDPDSRMLNLEAHRLALAIAKKTLDVNRFKTAQKTMDQTPPSFKIGDRVYFKNKQPSKWDLQWRPGYRIVHIEHGGHFLHTENQATRKVYTCNVQDIILEPPIEFWNVDTQFGIDRIFSAPYHPQSNGKLDVFHKYLKSTLKKLWEKDPSNWDKYLNQVLASYRVTPNLATAETPFFLVYGRDPNLPLQQLLEPMQCFLGDPDSRMLNLEAHRLALAIAKKTLDVNRFKTAQKSMDQTPPSFKIGDRVYFKNKQPSKWDLQWRPGYRIVHIEHGGHFLHTENQATRKVCSCNVQDIILEPPIEFWNVDTQFGIDRIFSAPYHPQSNGKLDVFHKYLKSTLKKLWEKDPSNWDKYLNQVLASYRVTPNLATAETPFFLVYGRDPNLPLQQLLEPMQCFLGDPDSRMLNLEAHRLALAIAKKTLDVNRFKTAQKTMDQTPPSFKIGDRVYFKNKQPSKWDLQWRPGYRIVHIEHGGHFLHTENQATRKVCSCNVQDIILEPPIEFWNVDTQFGIDRIFSAPYHPQSNGKLDVFHKYLKSTLKKLWEKDPSNWDKYLNQVLASYRVTPNLATAETPFFLVYGRDPNLPLQQLLEPMQCFLGDPDSRMLNLEAHRLALAIAKENLRCKQIQNSPKDHGPNTTILQDWRTESTSRTNSPANGTYNGGQDIELSTLSMVDISYIQKTKQPEKYAPVMCRTSFWSHPLNSGM